MLNELSGVVGHALNYLEDGMACEVVFYNGKAISVELPTTVVREVIYTEPVARGDTSGKVMKTAKIGTGFGCRWRLSWRSATRSRCDTRTAEYKRRITG